MTLNWKTFAVVMAAWSVACAASAAWADPPVDRTTQIITIRVLPYVEVMLDQSQVAIPIPSYAGSSSPVFVGGTVRTNFPVVLSVSITPPPDAPSTTAWMVETLVPQVETTGEHHFPQLLRIQASTQGWPYLTADHYVLNLVSQVSQTPGTAVVKDQRQGPAAPVTGGTSSWAVAYGGSYASGSGGSASGFSFAYSGQPLDSYFNTQGSSTAYGWSAVSGTGGSLSPQPGPPGTVTLLVMPKP